MNLDDRTNAELQRLHQQLRDLMKRPASKATMDQRTLVREKIAEIHNGLDLVASFDD